MTNEEISNKVKDLISDKLGVERDAVVDGATFSTDLRADSLDIVEFIMDVEKEFDITIPDEDASKLTTVKDAVDYIIAHKK